MAYFGFQTRSAKCRWVTLVVTLVAGGALLGVGVPFYKRCYNKYVKPCSRAGGPIAYAVSQGILTYDARSGLYSFPSRSLLVDRQPLSFWLSIWTDCTDVAQEYYVCPVRTYKLMMIVGIVVLVTGVVYFIVGCMMAQVTAVVIMEQPPPMVMMQPQQLQPMMMMQPGMPMQQQQQGYYPPQQPWPGAPAPGMPMLTPAQQQQYQVVLGFPKPPDGQPQEGQPGMAYQQPGMAYQQQQQQQQQLQQQQPYQPYSQPGPAYGNGQYQYPPQQPASLQAPAAAMQGDVYQQRPY